MGRYYSDHAREVKRELASLLDRDALKRLHRLQPWRHFVVTGRQLLILALATTGLAHFTNPLLWIPLAIVQGFTVFNFTVLLHEAVHHAVFLRENKREGLLNGIMSLCYAFPSGISASQFTRWHLDHHAELGSTTKDPKRFHLSPKLNRRWVKILYFTPALFAIYFRAAARETATYEEPLRRRIAWERRLTILFQFFLMSLCGALGGWSVMFRVYVVPVFLVFPVAFALNRMGQHYNVRPGDPAQWSTLVKSSWWWNFWFLNSNFHLEHHYFPGVPLYNLARLHELLKPFYAKRGMRAHGYGELFYRYVILNEAPHCDWEHRDTAPQASAVTAR
jgi:fatty acid desaturase